MLHLLLMKTGMNTAKRVYDGANSSDKQIKLPGENVLGFIGKEKKNKIKTLREKANLIEKKSVEKFYKTEENTDKSIEKLHSFKIDIYKSSFQKFRETIGLIKNIDFKQNINLVQSSDTLLDNLLKNMKHQVNIKKDRVSIQIFTSDVLVNVPQMLIRGTFSPISYSIGNAIKSCSNLDEKIQGAEAFLKHTKVVSEKNEVKILLLESTAKEVEHTIEIMNNLNSYLYKYIIKTNKIINKKFFLKNINYSTYSQEEKEIVNITISIALTLKNICDTTILDENGKIIKKASEVLSSADDLILKIKEL